VKVFLDSIFAKEMGTIEENKDDEEKKKN